MVGQGNRMTERQSEVFQETRRDVYKNKTPMYLFLASDSAPANRDLYSPSQSLLLRNRSSEPVCPVSGQSFRVSSTTFRVLETLLRLSDDILSANCSGRTICDFSSDAFPFPCFLSTTVLGSTFAGT